MHAIQPDKRRRGGALFVAIIISAIVGISLMSYVNLSLSSLKFSDRTFHSNAAINLSELGLEEALYCYNRIDSSPNPADAWTGWTISGNAVMRRFSGFSPGPGAIGSVKVYCQKYNPSPFESPYVLAESTIVLPQGPPVTKLVKINIRRRSIFGNGITGNQVYLYGNASADSYQSDPDGNPLTPPVAYSPLAARDNVLVAAADTSDHALDISGSGVNVYGRVASGGGAIRSSTWTTVQDEDSLPLPLMDPSLVTKDFAATFPPVSVPSPDVATVNVVNSDITVTTTFPRPGDTRDADGRFYYVFSSSGEISLPNLAAITIADDVTWILNVHSGATAIRLSNTNTLKIEPTGFTASLEVYTNGSVYFSNSSEINPTQDPSKLAIFGTNLTAGGQEIIFNNANVANLAIYAPNADLTANASVRICGAIVANTVELNNDAAFSLDESLGGDDGNPYRLTTWTELKTATQRDSFAGLLGF